MNKMKLGGRSRIRRMASSLAIVIVILLAVYSAWHRSQYMLLSLIIALLSMVPFFLRFERRNPHAREIVLIALLAAIAAVSRIPFAVIPSVQPMSFFIIIAAIAFGRESGFMIGATAALVSNMALGQGVWTPFQMFVWGMMGLSAGLLKNTRLFSHRIGLGIFGFIWGFLFGWMMNLTTLLHLTGSVSWLEFISLYVTSFYFDLLHALSNAVCLVFFGLPMLRILTRFRSKYGLLEEQAYQKPPLPEEGR